jgi:NADPH-dependent 2,4-dienoyl-CoA reductase/sulfur reductase-like enzyme/peroxiredoxin family protein/rhodanese-related sulfurtransferase/TusA-related sulfurtransferase
MSKKIIIVGGVAGGASSAARLRRLDEFADIIMFERDEYISYANCGLPYYIGETIKERDNLLIQTPQAMKARFNIDVRVNSEVVGIDFENKKVQVKSKLKGNYEESYDYIILSPGAKALKPGIPGIDHERIYTLRNIPDTDKIKAIVDSNNVKNAVVIGGGYVGVEMAENLRERGINVTIVEAAPHILAPFDSDMVTIAERELHDHGITLILNDGVKSFEEQADGLHVKLNSGVDLNSDMVILAIGVAPDTKFISNTPIKLGARGHILVNDKMETSVEGIYAVGDAIEVIDYINKSNTAIPLAGPANKQGRIAADNICGLSTTFKGTQGTSIIKIFGLSAAGTGNNERTLQRLNIPYKVIYVHPQSHASYYPGAKPMSLKLIFNMQGKILGAQAMGYDGIDKRIDDIANVIRLNGTVTDLTELELCYAPPYSSAKDPVNMAGFVAENVVSGKCQVVVPNDLDNYDKENTILLDVRTTMEFENGNIENSINIPLDDLRNRMDELDKNKEIVAICQVGLRGYIACRILTQHGFKVKNLTGGYKTYAAAKFTPSKIKVDNDKIDPDTQELKKTNVNDEPTIKVLDACGLCCPGPLMSVKSNIDAMAHGETLKVIASDPGFYEDIKSWCKRTNNELISLDKEKGNIIAFIKKNANLDEPAITLASSTAVAKDNKTMVVFSGDLDKAIASFIIANGAASMGKKVTMFFTFWGINILRKNENISVKKSFIEGMFGKMMPRGSKSLKLSNMNMAGMGPMMIRKIMKDKNVSSLEELIEAAIASGVEVVACQMSMDLLGLKIEELIDGVKIGGVGYYLGEAEDSNVNLFI